MIFMAAFGIGLGLFLQWGWQYQHTTRQIAEQAANAFKDLQKSDITHTFLLSIAVNNGPQMPARALILPVCTPWSPLRTADVRKDGSYAVERYISDATGQFKINLPPGLEHFAVKDNPNLMRPQLIAASNWPKYKWLFYSTALQGLFPAHGYEPMSVVPLYIIDAGQPLPKPGQHPPTGPGPHDGPQPSCPVNSYTPSAAGQ